jgi:hypothetical protein
MKKLILIFVAFMLLGFVGNAQIHTKWVYFSQGEKSISGKLYFAGNEIWKEKNSAATQIWEFEERVNSREEVILFDKSRNFFIRLTNNAMYYKDGEAGTWILLYKGRWDD